MHKARTYSSHTHNLSQSKTTRDGRPTRGVGFECRKTYAACRCAMLPLGEDVQTMLSKLKAPAATAVCRLRWGLGLVGAFAESAVKYRPPGSPLSLYGLAPFDQPLRQIALLCSVQSETQRRRSGSPSSFSVCLLAVRYQPRKS